jgi:hypothetical protein
MRLLLTLLGVAATLPASAAVVGVVEGQGSHIDFHDEPGICVGNALKAEHVPDKGARVQGCYTVGNGLVFVVFLDGEIAKVPAQAIKPPTKT